MTWNSVQQNYVDGKTVINAEFLNTLQDKVSEVVSVKDFGAVFDYDGTNGTDDSMAWAAAINWAMANYPKTLVVPDGFSRCDYTWPVITKPVSIVGNGRSYVCFTAAAVGQCVTVRNTGFNDEVGYMQKGGNVAFTDSSTVVAGTELRGFWLLGNRTSSVKQHGLVFEGNCDFCKVDLDIAYFNGTGFWTGKQDDAGIRGNFRESTLLNVRTRACGNADGTASILFELTDSTQAADSSNLCKNVRLECVFPYGRGIEFKDSRTVATGSPLYGFSGDMMLHGWQNASTNNGALLHIEGDINLLDFEVNIAYNRSTTPDIVFTRNATTGAVPRDIRLRTRHPNSLVAYQLDYGVNIQLDILYAFSRKEILTLGASFAGPLRINNTSNAPFLIYPASIQLSGTNAIALPSWTGGYNGFSSMAAFMPIVNANGTGDTMKVAIDGIVGTITRSGSTGAGTDTYTFTPDASSSSFIAANTYFSKFAVPSSQAGSVSGRYNYSETPQGGMSTSSSWNSGRLLSIGTRRLWVSADGAIRYATGEPASDSDGRALGVWAKSYVGVSATPSVATRNLLYANYASPTTITNFTGGQDAQVITVIANNGNCTIANNTTIVTKTGANVTMITNTALQFVYSSDLAKWVQLQ